MNLKFRVLVVASSLLPACHGLAAAKDSPRTLVNQALAEAGRHLDQQQIQPARSALTQVQDLHRQYGVELPAEFHFKYA